MPFAFDSRNVSKRFGALDSSQVARLDAVVAQAQRSAEDAQSLTPGVLSSLWSSAIGAESSAAALRANAASAWTLYDVLADKRNRLANDPGATEYDVQVVEGSVPALSNVAAREGAYLLTPGAALVETAKGTAADIAGMAKAPFGLPLWAWAAGAAALALFIVLPKGRRS